MDCGSCVRQLWSMPPIGAAWTESMHLGAELHPQAREEYCKDLELKSIDMARELGLCLQELRVMGDFVRQLKREKKDLEQQLVSVRTELAQCKELEEQEALVKTIWGPIVREVDSTWDPPPVLLTGDPLDHPVTLGRIAADLGFKNSAQHVRRLMWFVRQAFVDCGREHTGPKVYYDSGGEPERLSCFTERDREFISSVIQQHGER